MINAAPASALEKQVNICVKDTVGRNMVEIFAQLRISPIGVRKRKTGNLEKIGVSVNEHINDFYKQMRKTISC